MLIFEREPTTHGRKLLSKLFIVTYSKTKKDLAMKAK